MLSLTVRRLQVFVAIADCGGFAAAARRLGIAQPSVSAHVRRLEDEMQSPLFDRRVGGTALLTEAGRRLLAHARDVLSSASKLEAEVGASAAGRQRSLTLLCQRTVANSVLSEAFATFANRHRDIRVTVRIGTQEEVLDGVRRGAFDIGCVLGTVDVDGLTSRFVGRQSFVVIGAAGHPLAGRRKVPPAEVSRCDFVGPPYHSLFGQACRKLLGSVGIENVRIVSEANEFRPVRDLAVAGLGLCCSLANAARAEIEAGRLVVIDIDAPPLFIDVRQIMRANYERSEPMRRFSNFLAEVSASSR
ncbi:MAG TPA: LysR family transcriptional regulator [Beijerinckiaceae bacterium]|jgi:molybdate transport repressor ModE-like protein|nr:LysR family transcriptional regulator [Beijerinckiaceae bacterium]